MWQDFLFSLRLPLCSISCIYHIFFIHSFIFQRAFGLFPYLGCCQSCCNEHGSAHNSLRSWYLFFWIYPEAESVGYMVILFLTFWVTSILFPTITAPFYIPTKCTRVPSSLHPHQHCFNCDPSDRHEVMSYYGFHLLFPNDQWWWTSFHVLIGHLYMFFGENLIDSFAQFFPLLHVTSLLTMPQPLNKVSSYSSRTLAQ